MSIAENIAQVKANIERAALAAGRDPKEILLVGATKMNDASRVKEAIAAGLPCCGENRVQELLEKNEAGAYAGAELHFIGTLQKNKAKKVNPRRFVDTGLFRIVRCPNYLGEMIFWTGVLISGIGAVKGWQWLVCAIGYCGIIFVMFSGARRLEIRQNKNYGKDPEYQKFVKTVPILLPFVPLYSVEKYKWLVA